MERANARQGVLVTLVPMAQVTVDQDTTRGLDHLTYRLIMSFGRMSRNEFVREVLTLIHVSFDIQARLVQLVRVFGFRPTKTFVDKLWGEYNSRSDELSLQCTLYDLYVYFASSD